MLSIRPMTLGDLPHGMRLSAQAGWNQTEFDWRRAWRLADGGCFVALSDGAVVGTVATCRFDDVAWIGLMLVDADHRGRGFGKALMQHCLSWLDERGAASVRLDATSMGQPLYEKLGFQPQFSLARFGGAPSEASQPANATPLAASDVNDCLALDRRATGVDRGPLLRALLGVDDLSHGCEAFVLREKGALAGFVAIRPGAKADFVGPCLAATPTAGARLLQFAAAHRAGKQVMIDVPLDTPAAIEVMRSQQLPRQRDFVRMCRGADRVEQRDMLWASGGPEKG